MASADPSYRPLGFESDVANVNFAGAQNPDSLLHVEFYWHTPLDKNKTEALSEEKGLYTPVYCEKTTYVRIMRPGDKTSVIEEAVRVDHQRRWPEKWLFFQIQNGLADPGAAVPGWKIEDWKDAEGNRVLNSDQIHNLKFQRFYNVEQIAGASDAQVQDMGMGGLGLREKAKLAMKAKATEFVRDELAQKDRELAEMRERMAALEAMVKNAAIPGPKQARA